MADPGTAALDPIFYLHHCNIDRMWAAWNAAGHTNPVTSEWLKGPAQTFVMPMPGVEPWTYTPEAVQDTANLQYGYDNLAVSAAPIATLWKTRLMTLGVPGAASIAEPPPNAPSQPAELLGSSTGTVTLSTAVRTSVSLALHGGVRAHVQKSFMLASPVNAPDRVLLKLENVRGTYDATVLRVYAELPQQADPQVKQARLVGAVALFGLRRASIPDGQHAGAGLTFILDMSHAADSLFVENNLSADQLRIDIEPVLGNGPDRSVEVGRISIYRQPF
jgi:tyrosinase